MGQKVTKTEDDKFKCTKSNHCSCHTYIYDKVKRGFQISESKCEPTNENILKKRKINFGEQDSQRAVRIAIDKLVLCNLDQSMSFF